MEIYYIGYLSTNGPIRGISPDRGGDLMDAEKKARAIKEEQLVTAILMYSDERSGDLSWQEAA